VYKRVWPARFVALRAAAGIARAAGLHWSIARTGSEYVRLASRLLARTRGITLFCLFLSLLAARRTATNLVSAASTTILLLLLTPRGLARTRGIRVRAIPKGIRSMACGCMFSVSADILLVPTNTARTRPAGGGGRVAAAWRDILRCLLILTPRQLVFFFFFSC
jgi:hypothetical protein